MKKEQQTISRGKVKQSWRTNSLSFSDLGSDRIGWDRMGLDGIGIGIGNKGQAKGPGQTKECVHVDEDGHKSAPMR